MQSSPVGKIPATSSGGLTVVHSPLMVYFGMFAHEVRSQIGAAVTACEYLKRGNVSDNIVNTLTLAVTDTLGILDNMLMTVKIESGVLSVHPALESFNITDWANKTVTPFYSYPNHKQTNIVLSVSPYINMATIVTDRVKLTQILHNLLSNAIKFCDRNTTVAVNIRVQCYKLIITVTNKGSYISADQLRNLFTPFQQLDKGKAGNGLGLYLCRIYAETLGGSIMADSKEGITTFTVEVPVTISQ